MLNNFMNKETDVSKILDKIVELHKNYSLVSRRCISYDKYASIKVENISLQESLLEHVGNLPLVATFLYPYLDNKSKINLGRVLTMLAIHDIGELIVGDEHPHKKSLNHINSEHDAAISLLDKEYHELLTEFEMGNTLDAKFAKAMDVFSTFPSDQLISENAVKERFTKHDFSWQEILEKRYKVFSWDPFLEKLFLEVIERYKKIFIDSI